MKGENKELRGGGSASEDAFEILDCRLKRLEG